MDPGASGESMAKLAPLTAALSRGGIDEASQTARNLACAGESARRIVAVMVNVTGPALFPDSQVLCHVPFWMASKLSGGSPFENDAVTSPAFSALPQSSVTCASSTTGHAAGTPNDCPSVVIAGTSCVGVQLAVSSARSRSAVVEAADAGVTMVRTPTRRT